MSKCLAALLILLSVSGCKIFGDRHVKTMTTFHFVPDIPRNIDNQKLCVWVETEDTELKQNLENALQERLSDFDIYAVTSGQIMRGGTDYNDNYVEKILDREEIDAVLVFFAAGGSPRSLYVPGKSALFSTIDDLEEGGRDLSVSYTYVDKEIETIGLQFQSYIYLRKTDKILYSANSEVSYDYGYREWPQYFGELYINNIADFFELKE